MSKTIKKLVNVSAVIRDGKFTCSFLEEVEATEAKTSYVWAGRRLSKSELMVVDSHKRFGDNARKIFVTAWALEEDKEKAFMLCIEQAVKEYDEMEQMVKMHKSNVARAKKLLKKYKEKSK